MLWAIKSTVRPSSLAQLARAGSAPSPARRRRAPRPARRPPAARARAPARARWPRAAAGRPRTGAGRRRAPRAGSPTRSSSSRQRSSTRSLRHDARATRSSSASICRTVMPRVERRVRVLEDHLDPPRLSARLRRAGQRPALEAQLAAGRRVQPDDAAAERRLAATRLADQAERLAAARRRDRRRRRRAARLRRRPPARRRVEGDRDAAGSASAGLDVEQRRRVRPAITAPGARLRLGARARGAGRRSPGRRSIGAAGPRRGRSRPGERHSAGGSGSPPAARPARAACPGSGSARPGRRRSRAPSAAGRACTGGAARGRPRRTAPVSTIRPAYITATRLAHLGDHREVVGDEDQATPARSHRPSSSRRIWSWMVTSSAVVGSSQRMTLRARRTARSRSSPAGACRRRARAGRPRQRRSGSGMPTCRISSSARSRGLRACRARAARRGAFGDLLADPHHRVQRGHRLLEDHRDPRPAQRTAPAASTP